MLPDVLSTTNLSADPLFNLSVLPVVSMIMSLCDVVTPSISTFALRSVLPSTLSVVSKSTPCLTLSVPSVTVLPLSESTTN